MSKGFTQADLEKMGLKDNGDGTFSKGKTKPQPREVLNERERFNSMPDELKTRPMIPEECFRKIELTLFGIPMPKQSVRQGKNKQGQTIFYQDKKKKERESDYVAQIKKQLPPGFKMFEECVFVRRMHFVYPPLKSFHKIKGTMEGLRNGKKIYKNTRPDLPDNLKKLVNDCLSGLVYRDDCIIVGEDDVKKYYGTGGCVIIILEGY